MYWYLEVLKKYGVFHGRATRKEYWMFLLVHFIIAICLSIVDTFVGAQGILSLLYTLLIFLPSLSVMVRRLHDTNRSGWWALLLLVPVAGVIVLIVFCVQQGVDGPNEYGPDPVYQLHTV